MTARAETLEATRETAPSRWLDDRHFDAIFTAVCGWLLLGAFTDGWAHSHGITDETFFTPWHAFLYSGFGAAVVFAGLNWVRNRARGLRGRAILPHGYGLTAVGLGLFGVGGLGDMIWHELFGVEANLEAMYSPTHLVLMVGLLLVVTGPLRAARRRPGPAPDPALPTILALAYSLALVGFLTFFSNPLTNAYPQWTVGEGEALGIGSIFVQAGLLSLFLFVSLRRWQLPAGTFLLVLTLVYTGMAVITDEYRFIPVAALAGVVIDLLNERWRPAREVRRQTRWFAFLAPAVFFATYFAVLALTGGIAWTIHLWAGGIFLAGLTGLGLSYVVWE